MGKLCVVVRILLAMCMMHTCIYFQSTTSLHGVIYHGELEGIFCRSRGIVKHQPSVHNSSSCSMLKGAHYLTALNSAHVHGQEAIDEFPIFRSTLNMYDI